MMAEAEEQEWSFLVVFRELGEDVDGRSYYEDELEEELERLGLGEVNGGGSWLDGRGCDIDITVRDREAGLRVIREVLRRRNAPASTRILGDGVEFAVYE